MAHALDKTYQAQIELNKVLSSLGVKSEIPMPDISTKEKAQAYIGLDMKDLREKKDEFNKTIVPAWREKAITNKRLLQ